jgi:hypothetical protein
MTDKDKLIKIILYICIWIVGISSPMKAETRTPLPDTFVRDYLKTGKMKRIHGESRTKLYSIWHGMIYRCTNNKCAAFKNYGGRNISVCLEWKYFIVFKKWAEGNGYRNNLQIDRIDNNGNYNPFNCRFVTRSINHINRRKNIYFCIYKRDNCNRYKIKITRRPKRYDASAKTLKEAIIIRDKMIKEIDGANWVINNYK